MTYVRFRIDPRLSWVLGELGDSPLVEPLAQRLQLLAQTASAAPRPHGAELAEALSAQLALLHHVGDAGIPLTSAGYLKPADLTQLAPSLPTMHEWAFPITTEVHTRPYLWFREQLQRAGLVRVTKGRLMLTVAGKRARVDPEKLWLHLAERLVPSVPKFDSVAWPLVLLHSATDVGRRLDTDLIARILSDLGWRNAGSERVGSHEVQWVWNDAWAAIGNVGAVERDRWDERTLSPAAIALVRDALLVERPTE